MTNPEKAFDSWWKSTEDGARAFKDGYLGVAHTAFMAGHASASKGNRPCGNCKKDHEGATYCPGLKYAEDDRESADTLDCEEGGMHEVIWNSPGYACQKCWIRFVPISLLNTQREADIEKLKELKNVMFHGEETNVNKDDIFAIRAKAIDDAIRLLRKHPL